MSDRPAARARALLVADPDADPALVRSARAILAWGQVAVSQQSSTGDSNEYKQSRLKASIEDPEIDLVIVLRSERQPSHEVQQAAMLCGEIGKPVHALVARGVAPAVHVGEVHMIALDIRWETEHDLHNWAGSLNLRFGNPNGAA